MNQTPVTYGPPRCDSTGLCEPQTSPPPGPTTTIQKVEVINGYSGASQYGGVSVDVQDTNHKLDQLHHDMVFADVGIFFIVVLLLAIVGLLVDKLKPTTSKETTSGS